VGFLDSISSLFGTSDSVDMGGAGVLAPELGAGLGVVESFLGGQSSSAPTVQSYPSYSYGAVAQPAMAMTPQIAGPGIAAATSMIRFLVAQKLGLKSIPSLQRVMQMVRQMSKYLSPAAVAVALGLELGQLATIIAASNRRKRRHVNPANVKALRRSMRRLGSFQKLASRVNKQLSHVGSHRRGAVHRGRCSSCRKSPCSC